MINLDELHAAPEEVITVAQLADKAAADLELEDDSIYVSLLCEGNGKFVWCICDNFERCRGSLIYDGSENRWFYRYKDTGEDEPLADLASAKAEAIAFYC